MRFASVLESQHKSSSCDTADDKIMMVTSLLSTGGCQDVSTPLKPRSMTADTDRFTSNISSSSSNSNEDDSSSSSPQGDGLPVVDESCGKPQAAAAPTMNTTANTVNATSATFAVVDDSSAAAVDADITIMTEDFAGKLVAQVRRRLDSFLAKSPHIRANTKVEELPRFTRGHLNLGKTLAKGGFSNIIEVNSFNNEECALQPLSAEGGNQHQQQSGEYVVKCLNTRLGLKKLPGATKDIVFEAHTLACLQHENIVQIRGWSHDGIDGFQTSRRADGFFIILDRLGDTLFQKVFQWQHELKGRGKYGNMKKKISLQKIVKQQFQEKIQVCVDVANALAYCHERRIIHRDIKSANVAFDRDGRAKLIDFGLATELPAQKPRESHNKVYELTGNIGTARYMSPEVILERPYNEKADVHSFAVLCWECCAAKKPYSHLDAKKVKEHVSRWNERPKAYWSWPRKLRRILKQGWAKDPKERPTMVDFRTALLKVQKSLPKSTIDFSSNKDRQ